MIDDLLTMERTIRLNMASGEISCGGPHSYHGGTGSALWQEPYGLDGQLQ